jgi:nucleoid-associated protein YgaU
MTSSIKIGIISFCVVGVGLGVYLVKHGTKDDPNVKNSSAAKTGTNGATAAGGTPAAAPGAPAAPGTGSAATTDENAGRVASPPAWSLNDLGSDNERSFRPHTPETTVPPPSVAGAGQGNTGPTDSPTPAAGSPTPSDTGSGAAAAGPPPVNPSVPPVQTPAAPSTEQMGLRDASTLAPPAGPGGSTTAKPVAPAPIAPEKSTIHVVQRGDTLSGLAVKYLGSTRYATLIAKANPNIKPNRLLIGAKLKIPAAPVPTTAPAGGAIASAAQKPKLPAAPPVDPARAYTVKPNDKWENLAERFLGNAHHWTVFYEYNKERFPKGSRTLRPGMVLEIPPKEAAAPTEAVTPKTATTPKK